MFWVTVEIQLVNRVWIRHDGFRRFVVFHFGINVSEPKFPISQLLKGLCDVEKPVEPVMFIKNGRSFVFKVRKYQRSLINMSASFWIIFQPVICTSKLESTEYRILGHEKWETTEKYLLYWNLEWFQLSFVDLEVFPWIQYIVICCTNVC